MLNIDWRTTKSQRRARVEFHTGKLKRRHTFEALSVRDKDRYYDPISTLCLEVCG
jgi:hypothetical protein